MKLKHLRVLAAAVALSAASTVGATPSTVHWKPYTLELRSGEKIPAEVGSIDVPAIRRQPNSGTLKIGFVRLPAYPGASGPPIIYLAGGPGSSGVGAAQGDRYRLFDRLRHLGDVILLDQRGIGLSSAPPACSTQWAFPVNEPATEQSLRPSFESGLRQCAAEWRAAGVNLEAFNTADNAADVADLIRALGAPKARLIGISYGTFLGFAVLRDHGALIDRAIFAGTEGPDHTVKLPTAADEALLELSAEMAATGKGGPVAADLAGSVRRLFATLAKGPVMVPLEDGSKMAVSLFDAQLVTSFLMASGENAVRLPEILAEAEKGDFGQLAANARRLRGFYGAYPAMSYATDGASGTSPRRIREGERLVRRSIFGNAVNFPNVDIAGALGIEQLPARYWSPLRTSVPGYFISGSFDWRTPPAQAREVMRGFKTHAHLVLDGAGHDNDLFLSSPIILDRIEAFFSGKAVHDETLKVTALSFE